MLRILIASRLITGHDGITKNIQLLAAGLRDRGCDVAITSSSRQTRDDGIPFFRWLNVHGIPHYYTPFPERTRPLHFLSQSRRALSRLKYIYEDFEPDILHNFSPFSLSPFGYLMRRITGTPYVSECQVTPQPDRLEVKVAAMLSRVIDSYLGDRVLAISSHIRDEYHSLLHIPEWRTALIFNGVDTDYFKPPTPQQRIQARTQFGLSPEDRVVCLVGRLGHAKGHDVLLQAVQKIIKDHPLNIHVLFAGSGDNEAAIRAMIHRLDLQEIVSLLGFVKPRPVYWASDLNVLPSTREGWGNVIAEGMHCGVVPIRTPTAGAVDQIQNGRNGFIISFDDPDSLANRIHFLLRNDEKRNEMSRAAIQTAQRKFSYSGMIDKTLSLYKSVVK